MTRDEFILKLAKKRSEVFSYAYAVTCDLECADDIVQETYLTALKKWKRYDPARPLVPWLKGMVKILIKEKARKNSKLRILPPEDIINSIEKGFEHHDIIQENLEMKKIALRKCMKKLPERLRTVLTLRYKFKLRISEVGKRISKTTAAAQMLLIRIQDKLKSCISSELKGRF